MPKFKLPLAKKQGITVGFPQIKAVATTVKKMTPKFFQ
jgi:hypothetical protein